jgi:hypothetical protein
MKRRQRDDDDDDGRKKDDGTSESEAKAKRKGEISWQNSKTWGSLSRCYRSSLNPFNSLVTVGFLLQVLYRSFHNQRSRSLWNDPFTPSLDEIRV